MACQLLVKGDLSAQLCKRLREQRLSVSRILTGLVFVFRTCLNKPFAMNHALSLSKVIEEFLEPTGIGT